MNDRSPRLSVPSSRDVEPLDLVQTHKEGVKWSSSSVLLRMSRSPTRFRLLLVFNHNSSLRGLWLRPI